jgi:hypothetical protein
MAEKIETTKVETVDDEVTKLRARVKKLEAERDKADKEDNDGVGRRYTDSLRDARHSKVDTATRVARGVTLASVEFFRLFTDTLTGFGDDVIRRNESRSGTVRNITRRLPEDIVDGFANAVDRFSDIPAKASERYTKAYREGENTHSKERD